MMSQGFGFIECKDREQALKAYKTINGITIDNHQLRLSFAQRGVQEDNSSKRKNVVRGKPTTKLMVRNVPFQATKKEIRHLFAAFGELRSVRLPSKAGGKGHRGFAFVEFLTKDEAKFVFRFGISVKSVFLLWELSPFSCFSTTFCILQLLE
jgi:multiple RNA-binding domain-containing protein 1